MHSPEFWCDGWLLAWPWADQPRTGLSPRWGDRYSFPPAGHRGKDGDCRASPLGLLGMLGIEMAWAWRENDISGITALFVGRQQPLPEAVPSREMRSAFLWPPVRLRSPSAPALLCSHLSLLGALRLHRPSGSSSTLYLVLKARVWLCRAAGCVKAEALCPIARGGHGAQG